MLMTYLLQMLQRRRASEFARDTLKERISGFVNIDMDTLKTPKMKICIANAFARDSRFTIIRSEERVALVALQAMNFEEPDSPVGVELEVSVEHINAYDDPVFTGYRNQNVSDSDSSDSD